MHCVEPGPSQVAVTFEVIGCFRTRGAAMVLPAEDEVRNLAGITDAIRLLRLPNALWEAFKEQVGNPGNE